MTVYIGDEHSHDSVDVARLKRLAEFVLHDLGIAPAMELSVLCVDVDAMTELNRMHMGADRPTDVLAFPLDDPEVLLDQWDEDAEDQDSHTGLLGDVVICPQVAVAQASELGRTPAQEIDLLVVHGILHVLGHDHAEDDEKAIMFGLTDRLLAEFSRSSQGAHE